MPTEISITFTVQHDNREIRLEREETARTEIYMNLDLALHIFWLRVSETFPLVGVRNVTTTTD